MYCLILYIHIVVFVISLLCNPNKIYVSTIEGV